MRWRDIQNGTFRKLDLRIEKTADMRILTGVLHDACFDFSQIRYTRRRLTIPLTRHPAECENDKLRPISLVDGELILYPVLRPCDWQITLSGEWLNKPERLCRELTSSGQNSPEKSIRKAISRRNTRLKYGIIFAWNCITTCFRVIWMCCFAAGRIFH